MEKHQIANSYQWESIHQKNYDLCDKDESGSIAPIYTLNRFWEFVFILYKFDYRINYATHEENLENE